MMLHNRSHVNFTKIQISLTFTEPNENMSYSNLGMLIQTSTSYDVGRWYYPEFNVTK